MPYALFLPSELEYALPCFLNLTNWQTIYSMKTGNSLVITLLPRIKFKFKSEVKNNGKTYHPITCTLG